MDDMCENRLNLLGKTPQEAAEELGRLGLDYEFVYTRDPKSGSENIEERVVRIKPLEHRLEILVGCFQVASARHFSDE